MKRPTTLACLLLLVLPAPGGTWKFDFGTEDPAEGFEAAAAVDRFDPEAGHGFDLVGKPVDRGTFVTGEGGFYFSVTAPPGNYHVRVRLGDPDAASNTTIKAESRRLMVHGVELAAGESTTENFVVNIRTPEIKGGKPVRLKDREKPCLHWDDKLTLEFNGPRPAVDWIEITPEFNATTVFLLGDSTVTDQPHEPWNSWGQMLPVFFDDTVAVANHAESGESVRSSLGARRFEQVYRTLRPGDYVLMQFGHNDMKDKRPDAVETYRRNLHEAVDKIRALKAHPVLVTSMERKAGIRKLTLTSYPDAMRELAAAEEVPLIDLHRTSLELYRGLGDQLGAAFQDPTHHNNFGSMLLARCVAEGIRATLPELATHFRPELPAFDPAKPPLAESFDYPPSPLEDLTKPDGD